MSGESLNPDFDFNFRKIHDHWRQTLANHAAAEKYLQVVEACLQKWLEGLGPWIDFELAAKHLREDLELSQVESHLSWVASRHRLLLTREEKKRLAREDAWPEEEMRVDIKLSADGRHDAVWHEDFRDLYCKAMDRERKELRKLRETGVMPAVEEGA